MVLASEPVCICGVDVAAPQQLRMRNSQQKMSMAELRSIFSRQFTEYEVRASHIPSHLLCQDLHLAVPTFAALLPHQRSPSIGNVPVLNMLFAVAAAALTATCA